MPAPAPPPPDRLVAARRRLGLVLKGLSSIFFLATLMHLCFGVRAETMLGTPLPAEALNSAGLDSQNRFYGVTFSLYGFLLWLAAKDPERYAAVLRLALGLVFAGGCARLVAVALHGWPPPLISALLAAELALPPPLAWWLRRLGL